MRSFLALSLLSALVLAGCGGDDDKKQNPSPKAVTAAEVLGPAGGLAQPDGGVPVALTVSGKISFERLLPTPTGLGATPVTQNAALVQVEVVRHDDFSVLLAPAAFADANGDYSISFSTDRDFFVRARARLSAATLDCRVLHSQMASPVVHAVSSAIVSRALGSQTVNVTAGLALPHLRAGAFAALDTARKLAQAAAYSGSPALGTLDLYWAPGNLGTSFMRDLGGQPVPILETRFVNTGPLGNPGILVGGGDWNNVSATDHDEFDEAVLAHEFVHFLMRGFSRDNNWGGAHNGEALTPNAAYGEGLPTGLGCILLGDKNYIDTQGLPPASSVRFSFDCENPAFVAGVPSAVTGVSGYQAEFAVAAVVWDLLDGGTSNPASTDGDPVALARDGFLQSFYALSGRTGAYDLVWLASLLQQLIDDARLNAGNAHTLVSPYNASFPPAVAEQWPPALGPAANETGTLNAALGPGATPANAELGQTANAVWRMELAGPQSVTLNLTATAASYSATVHQLDLYVYDLGNNLVASQRSATANKTLSMSLAAGVYMVRVHHAATSPAASGYTLTRP
ncbi:MAG: hypothetical protein BroJett014_20510 [Planctomycetota bacterium]|nr:hypothetical protein [Planctomycetota bacterium]GIK53078.1 MAG: hypothetical protein BroJett014_20510 [Planctomycetota bacterium]